MPQRVKILFLIGSYSVGGKERQLSEIIRHLPQDEFEIHLFAKYIDAFYLTDEYRSKLSSIRTLDKPHFQFKDVWALKQYIDEVRPDVVFSFSTTLSHFSAVAKLFTSHKFSLVNGSIRDAPRILNLNFKIERFLYRFYKYVVANSYAGLQAYGQAGKSGRYVLYNGFNFGRIPKINKAEARKRADMPEDRFIVSMVAAIANRKDHLTFIRAAQECVDQQNDILFYIVGTGSGKQKLEQYVSSNNLSAQVKFLGERSDVEVILTASDVSVLTSAAWHGEGISNSILESLACGTPVIATDNGGTKEIVIDGENGFVVPPEDASAVAKKIIYLKNNPNLLQEFSQTGLSQVHREFSIEKMIQEFISIIRRVLKL